MVACRCAYQFDPLFLICYAPEFNLAGRRPSEKRLDLIRPDYIHASSAILAIRIGGTNRCDLLRRSRSISDYTLTRNYVSARTGWDYI